MKMFIKCCYLQFNCKNISHASSTLLINTRAPRAVCSALCCSHCTLMTALSDMKKNHYYSTVTLQSTLRPHIRRKSTILQMIVDIGNKEANTNPCLHQCSWNRWTILGFWESASAQRTSDNTTLVLQPRLCKMTKTLTFKLEPFNL